MPQIRANRESVDDRYSVLGFTIRTESPLFEVGIATDPALFQVANKSRRQRSNFYSSRVGGSLRARRGEAVYLLPPQVLSNFVGNPKLYFGLATYGENAHGRPNFVQAPHNGNMYVDLSGLSGRGLQRMVSSATPPVYGNNGSEQDISLIWGGDALPQGNGNGGANSNGNGNANGNGYGGGISANNGNGSQPHSPQNGADPSYDDGFGPFPQTDNSVAAQPPQTNGTQQPVQVTPAPGQNAQPQTDQSGSNQNNAVEVVNAPQSNTQNARPLELIRPFYDPADPASALMSQNNAFSLEREEWFVGVPNTTLFPHSAICQLKMTGSDGSTYQGTGFYIGRDRVLTCAHNLSGMSSVTIIPGKNGAGNKPYGEVSVNSSSWRIAPSYTGSGNWENDLAVIDDVPLAAPNGQHFNFLQMTPSDQLPIVVCGYSAGSRVVPELNEIIDGDKQHLHGGYVASQSNLEVMEYPILTLMGASGSPVYHLSSASGQLEALIAGVHVTGQPAANGLNRGCFITPNKIDWIEGRTTTFALSENQYQRQNQQLEQGYRPQQQNSRALAIPLDPGEGGMSIGVDALQAGDIIVSTARHIVSYAIRLGTLSAISHAMLYVGDGKVIEAVGEGVREVPIEQAIEGALVAVAYRDPRVSTSIASAIVAHARSRVGNPYNYAGVGFIGYRILNPGGAVIIDAIGRRLGLEVGQASAVYCSELVFEAYEQAGVPLGQRAATSTPDDLVDLFGNLLTYVGHLLASDVPLGIALSQSSASYNPAAPRAMSGGSFSVHWDTVPYQPQSSVASCWAACAAMVAGWLDNMSIPDTEIAAKVPIIGAYKNGLWPNQRQVLAEVWELVAEPPASYTIDAWRGMLESYGPIYLDMTFSGSSGGHARVLVGMESGGATDGSDTTMFMFDPWPDSPGRLRLTFAEFLTLYENRTDNSGGYLDYQILHSAELPAGVYPVTAAPFSVALNQDVQVPADQTDAGQANGGQINGEQDYTPQLLPPPEPLLQQALQQQLAQGASRPMEAATVAIASVVVGAVMERLVNNQGDIKWELDQLRGFKHPNDTAPSPMPPAHDGHVIRLTDWPSFTNYIGDEISAGFEVNWQYNGNSVGNVMISNIRTNDAVGWGLIIKAKIMDDNIVYPRDNPTFAALRVRLEYRFTRTIGSDLIAIRDLHLFGNGRYNSSGRWAQS